MNPIPTISRDKNGMFTNSLSKSYSVESLTKGLKKESNGSNEYLKSLEQMDNIIKKPLRLISRDSHGMFVNQTPVENDLPSTRSNSVSSLQQRESMKNSDWTNPEFQISNSPDQRQLDEKLTGFVVDASIERPSSRASTGSRVSFRSESVTSQSKPPLSSSSADQVSQRGSIGRPPSNRGSITKGSIRKDDGLSRRSSVSSESVKSPSFKSSVTNLGESVKSNSPSHSENNYTSSSEHEKVASERLTSTDRASRRSSVSSNRYDGNSTKSHSVTSRSESRYRSSELGAMDSSSMSHRPESAGSHSQTMDSTKPSSRKSSVSDSGKRSSSLSRSKKSEKNESDSERGLEEGKVSSRRPSASLKDSPSSRRTSVSGSGKSSSRKASVSRSSVQNDLAGSKNTFDTDTSGDQSNSQVLCSLQNSDSVSTPSAVQGSGSASSIKKSRSKINLAISVPEPFTTSLPNSQEPSPAQEATPTPASSTPKKKKKKKRAEEDQQNLLSPQSETDHPSDSTTKKKLRKERKKKQAELTKEHLNDLTDDGGLIPTAEVPKKPPKEKRQKKRDSVTTTEKAEPVVVVEPQLSPTEILFQSLGHQPEDYQNSTISIHVHKCDSLKPSLNLRHPMVQVHIVDTTTGQYLLKSDPLRQVTYFNEPSSINYVLPTLSKPFDLKENQTRDPVWDEKILLNESYLHILQPSIVILFEVVDLYTTLKDIKKSRDTFHRVAWAFMKPVGGNGRANTEKDARLQLFEYPDGLLCPPNNSPFVYQAYLSQNRRKYPSTFYTSIRAHGSIHPPPPKVFDHDFITTQLPNTNTLTSLLSMRSIPVWTRKTDEQCKLPNKLQYRIEAGSQGSFASGFSHNGLFIAVGCIGSTSHEIKILSYTTGDRISTLKGHQDMIYTIEWSTDDTQLLTCSSDGSARVWALNAEMQLISSCVFTHPCFVYTGTFHPTKSNVVVTGGYDGFIRFWSTKTSTSSKPKLKLPSHGSIVNSLCFNKEGNRLYSGDAGGNVKIWAQSEDSFECIKTVDNLQVVQTNQGNPVHTLRLHPGNRKLLVQTGTGLHMLDTRIHRYLTHYHPQQHLFSKPCFSACGTFIFASVGNSVCVYKTESGRLITHYTTSALTSFPDANVLEVIYHPYDHTLGISFFGAPGFVCFKWDKDTPELKQHAMKVAKHLDVDQLVKRSLERVDTNTIGSTMSLGVCAI